MVKTWTIEEIRNLLLNNDKVLLRGIVAIYNLQTEDEKISHETSHSNGVGFNGFDSKILSSFAEQVLYKGFLSKKQIAIARKKMAKYSKQLLNIANNKS